MCSFSIAEREDIIILPTDAFLHTIWPGFERYFTKGGKNNK